MRNAENGVTTEVGLDFWPAEVDFAGPGNGCNEGRLEFAAKAAHSGEGELKGGSHVLPRHVAGLKTNSRTAFFSRARFSRKL